jgi:biotin carboxyl carrier protein
MKKYEIEINNEVYRVAVKELSADAEMSTEQTTTESTPENEPTTQPVTSAEGTEVKAPMPGTILKVNVSAGQSVAEGEALVVLEAMKMENEVVAPADGVVGEIFVNANDRVEADQILLTI